MVKWQPFASMPEQFTGIIDILNDLYKTKKPIVSVDMKEQIGRIFIHSIQTHEEKSISYFCEGIIQDMYINVLHIEPIHLD